MRWTVALERRRALRSMEAQCFQPSALERALEDVKCEHEGERANRTRERGATTARIIAERRGGMSGQDRGLTLTTQPYIGLLPYDG